jgi:hypothetical protein
MTAISNNFNNTVTPPMTTAYNTWTDLNRYSANASCYSVVGGSTSPANVICTCMHVTSRVAISDCCRNNAELLTAVTATALQNMVP